MPYFMDEYQVGKQNEYQADNIYQRGTMVGIKPDQYRSVVRNKYKKNSYHQQNIESV